MSNERIDLTQFEKDEYDDRFYKVEACIGDYTRYMNEDETDIRLSKQLNLLPKLIDELKRCYEMIDVWAGKVPYVEHCEDCGATDGGDVEGCDYCGITHYRSKPRGFLHRDSPKW